jgi:lipopolysaccharide biosynthesis glycosyltransferase
MSTPVRVVLAADQGYARPLAVTARSVVANFDADRDLELFVIDMGIAAETRASIAESVEGPRTTINWVEGAEDLLRGLPTVGWFTTAAYARLLIPDLLPESIERVIYLDSDVVVRKSIDGLFNTEIGDHLALAAPDQGAPFVSSQWGLAHWYESDRAPSDTNFNTGVMLIDVSGWRRESVREQALDYVRSDRFWRNVDQEALNAVVGRRFGPIDPHWNMQGEVYVEECVVVLPYTAEQVESLKRDPWLIHYSLGAKPWMHECAHPWLAEWFKYLDQTAFAGWRPAGPSFLQRGFSEVRRLGGTVARRFRLT